MKKFSNFKFSHINEQEITLPKVEDTVQQIQPIQVTVSGTAITSSTASTDSVAATQSSFETQQGQQIENKESSNDPKKLFSKLFESREMAHVYHLQVNGSMGSNAMHVALNTYYDEIIEKIDSLVEIYTGQYDIIKNYDVIDTTSTNTKDCIEYFKELVDFIKIERYKCLLQEDTHLQNIVDEVVALIYKTLYKLRFTK